MLYRFILGFAPANLVAALVSFGAIYAFTRLVLPEEFGRYALVVSVATMCQATFFYWLHVGATRFVSSDADPADPAATAPMVATLYVSFFWSAAGFSMLYALAVHSVPIAPALRQVLWVGLPLIVLRSLVALNQAIHRGQLRVLRYNLIECSQAAIGLGVGLVLVTVAGFKGMGILLGMVIASALVLLADLRFMASGMRPGADRSQQKSLLSFGLPLTVACALNFILATSDRLLVEYFLGAGPVGIYAVSYGVIDRALTSVFLVVSIAAYPLVVRRLEQEGALAAEGQLYRNGVALLALAVPACVGLIVLRYHVAAVLIGPQFREPALAIMPWIAVATLMAGLQVHFFDHAFHLGKRTDLLLWSAGPAAVINIVLNIVLLPRIGLTGAVIATVCAYAVSLTSSIVIGRRAFRVPFPYAPLARILVASLAMLACLLWLDLHRTPLGLVGMIVAGGLSYGLAAIALDIGGLRSKLTARAD